MYVDHVGNSSVESLCEPVRSWVIGSGFAMARVTELKHVAHELCRKGRAISDYVGRCVMTQHNLLHKKLGNVR